MMVGALDMKKTAFVASCLVLAGIVRAETIVSNDAGRLSVNFCRDDLVHFPKSGLAVAIDIGNAKDIHPKNKYDVGHRLALWARRDVYGEKNLVPSGPLYKGMKVEGSKARISFEYVGFGLMAAEKGPDTPGVAPVPSPDGVLKGFAIAGGDRQWHWAKATIEGDEVVVSSDKVKDPVAVRYAYRANPMGDCNLYNKDGLPASPFRTDNW